MYLFQFNTKLILLMRFRVKFIINKSPLKTNNNKLFTYLIIIALRRKLNRWQWYVRQWITLLGKTFGQVARTLVLLPHLWGTVQKGFGINTAINHAGIWGAAQVS